jgi:hypothetical protein
MECVNLRNQQESTKPALYMLQSSEEGSSSEDLRSDTCEVIEKLSSLHNHPATHPAA